jgi:chromatin assembly factor 1 subunit B
VTRGEDGYASVTHVSTLTGHSKTVNCVRFSPSGSHLVSSGDGGEMLLWAPADADAPRGNLCADDGGAAAGWRRAALLRGHTDDVMDVAWAADGTALLSGSIDNKAILWEVSDKRRGAMVATFANHKHFVQGVAWDPAQQFVVTQSADRTCRVYALRPPAAGKRTKVSQYMQPACDLGKDFYCAHTLAKRVVAPPAPAPAPGAATGAAPAPDAKPERHPLFQDEAVPSFFRRLAWSPDGAFLAAPAGLHRAPGSPKEVHTAYIYARGRWAAPVAHLPAQTKPVVAVRFCPVVYRRAPGAAPPPAPFDQLPYTLVFAVATLDSVIVYDTASPLPLAVLGQLHYDSITDLAWARDGRYLAVASRDCYCSIAAFDPGELGDPAAPEDLPAHIAKRVFGAADQAAAAAQASPARAQAAPAAAMPAPAVAAAAAARLETGAAPPPAAGPKPARRIQPEPVGPDAAAKRGKRIVPEEIGPLAAVVGDSQVSVVMKPQRMPCGCSLGCNEPRT